MSGAFVDTSSLLKLYVAETGSLWMNRTVRPAGISISALAITEVGTSLSRHVREGLLTPREARFAWHVFRCQLLSFTVIWLDFRSLRQAANLAARSTVVLRTLDAIQLQGAVEARSAARRTGVADPIFISSDARLNSAAEALAFKTDDPLNHL